MRRINIASFNLLNLHRANQPLYGFDGYSADDYAEKVRWTAGIFDLLNSDLLAVQEVFDEQALRDCVAGSRHLRDATTIVAPRAHGDNTLPRVGLVSALPLLGAIESIADIPEQAVGPVAGSEALGIAAAPHAQFSRPVLATTVDFGAPGKPLPTRVYVVHLKSRRPKTLQIAEGANAGRHEDDADPGVEARAHLRSLTIRGIEATGLRLLLLRDLVRSRMPVIVLGDFNDHAKAMTTEMITGRIYARRPERRDHNLWHAAALQRPNSLKRDVGYTHVHLGEPGSIDHILLSEEFMRESRNAIGEVLSVAWFNDHLNDRSSVQSDHGAIRATLGFPD